MTNRTILYGYNIENGKFTVNEEEAETVKKIYHLYAQGKPLKSIANILTEKKVVYFNGEANWNKNTVSRILGNKHYTGDEKYPQILSEFEFEAVRKEKEIKSFTKEKQSPLLEHLKTICYCGECGKRIKRLSKWSRREKWMCEKGCKCNLYIDDKLLESAILNIYQSVYHNPDILYLSAHSEYIPTNEVKKEENKLFRLMEQPMINFKTLAHSILDAATVRFNCCEFDKRELSEIMINDFEGKKEMKPFDFVKRYVKKVKINAQGELTAVFINDAVVTVIGGKENDTGITKASNGYCS